MGDVSWCFVGCAGAYRASRRLKVRISKFDDTGGEASGRLSGWEQHSECPLTVSRCSNAISRTFCSCSGFANM